MILLNTVCHLTNISLCTRLKRLKMESSIPPSKETARAGHLGAWSLQHYLRTALHTNLDIQIPTRPMWDGVQVILSTKNMLDVYVRRREHMLGRMQSVQALQANWLADIHHSMEVYPRSHGCLSPVGCDVCVPREVYVFWNGDMPPFALRSCLDFIVQTACLHLTALTYEPGPFSSSFAHINVMSAECCLAVV